MTRPSLISLPLAGAPLIHALTNSITSELVANSLLAIGAKPIMAEDLRELPIIVKAAAAVLLNLGQMSLAREESLRQAAVLASQYRKPLVVDAVGITQLPNRLQLVQDLLQLEPSLVKGNISEMRALLGLSSQARGVDACQADQDRHSLVAFEERMVAFSLHHPQTCFLGTGIRDCLAFQGQIWWMENGVDQLDQVTGTGDVLGALIAGFLAGGLEKTQTCLQAVTYLNRCGEKAYALYPTALASFGQEVLNQLGRLYQEEEWYDHARIYQG